MLRLLIICNPGAGKTTMAVELGKRLDLPVYHLDKYFWNPGWITTDRETWRNRVKEFVNEEEWIIDGNYDNSLDIRLPQADTVIFLDFPTRICLWRIIKRIITSWGRIRPDSAEGCPKRFDFSFVKWVWRFRRDTRPKIVESLSLYFRLGNLIVLTSAKEVERFLIN